MESFSYNLMVQRLNSEEKRERLDSCNEVREAQQKGYINRKVLQEVNNHVHTIYSFSPYSPTLAAFKAWEAGLTIVGSVDHDSISASREIKAASALIGIASTSGFELRVSFLDSPFKDKKINNPDSKGIVYMVVHGVKESAVDQVAEFLKPVQKARNKRNRKQVEALNALIAHSGLPLIDFDKDVVPISKIEEGGSITERHILYALSQKMYQYLKSQKAVVSFLKETLTISIPSKIETILLDIENEHFLYDLLGLFKSAYLDKFFIQPSSD
ncbi:MAG: PHP domain-containing protein, partial [Spirochaetia bacterium]|nr:PHP domain-containing protein [Spirochaetia bacterium]